MTAADDVWQAAGEAGLVPVGLDVLPHAVMERLRAWLRAPLQRGCEHPGPLVTVMGARVALCLTCAASAGLDVLTGRCGGCGDPVDAAGLQAIYAVTNDLHVVITACSSCATGIPKEQTMNDRDRIERIRTARSVLTEARERHDAERARREAEKRRRAELLASFCRVCGGPVAAGEGERLPAPPADRHGDCWSPVHESWVLAPKDADRWRRAHDSCAKLDRAGIVRVLTGLNLATERALEVDAPVPEAALWPWNRTGAQPWSFMTSAELEALRAAAELAQAAGRSILCSDGACGCCGRRYSSAWFESDLRWADGSPAPVCGECDAIWMRWGGSSPHAAREERQRAATLELLTGYRLPLGHVAPAGLEPYCRSSDGNPVGHEMPFAWSPQLHELRREVWTSQPHLAPEDRRQEFQTIHDEQVAAERARRRAEAEQETVAAW